MLRLVAYDIASPRRLRRVAEACEDHGVRIQKSLFECWLEEPEFTHLWTRLCGIIDAKDDCLVAYTLDSGAARVRRTAGVRMHCTDRFERYLF